MFHRAIYFVALLLVCSVFNCQAFTCSLHSGSRLTYVNPRSLHSLTTCNNGEPLIAQSTTSLYAHEDCPRNMVEQVTKGFTAILLSVGLASQVAYAEPIQTLDFSMVGRIENIVNMCCLP